MSIDNNNEIKCSHCEDSNYHKKGIVFGEQRYYCKSCKRYFTMKPKRHSKELKSFAILLYLNNTGIRKIAKILKVSHPTILRWIRQAYEDLQYKKLSFSGTGCDIIEFDEIYTYIKKNQTGLRYGLLFLVGRSVLLRL